ncbi:MAG: carboxypeptidase-like regulatory domain-containing protein, partial [Bacteroidales bacterium]|nr:carboxypeptidase-like regulatory domain-containing protein [Bacteroidales bacterium]
MRYCRLLLMTVLLFVSLALSAQRIISGRITDSENGSPIPGASIFFSTTTVGTTTDAEGHYRLKIPGEGAYRLVVSHVGYQPVFKDITPGKTQITIDVAMYTHEMEEVMITTKSNVRNKDIDLFWKTILGKKPSKKDIQAMNPNAVYYYYNPETNKFTVTCRVPLQIVNHETGYHIQFVLKRFMIDYDVDNISWEGEYLFTELEPDNYKQMETWEINRKKIYRTTIGNFIKALYHDNTLEEGFLFVNIQKYSTPVETKTVENKLVFSDGKLYKTHTNKPTASYQYDLIDPDYFILTDSVTGNKSFHILPYQNVMMVSFGRPVTQRDLEKAKSQVPWERIGSYRNNISTPERQVFIYPDGSYRNPIRFTPKFNSYPVTGLNMMLPLDYHPDGESGMMNVFSENQPDEAPETNSLATCLMKVGKQFERQLSLFPQEKIYLQTDKPYYVTGERIWFRAHVMDAATHVPSFSLGSVFVELFDARDSVVSRIKTGPANDLYSGYLHIPEDLPEGDYVIRAYTDGMRDLDEDYFFMKSIRIGGPASRIMHIHPE